MSARPDTAQTNSLLDDLVELPARVRRLYRRGGFEGLEANVLQVLIELYRVSDQTVGTLAEHLALTQSTVSTALGILAERGLLQGKTDPLDRRRQRQCITGNGRTLVRRFLAHARTRLSDLPE